MGIKQLGTQTDGCQEFLGLENCLKNAEIISSLGIKKINYFKSIKNNPTIFSSQLSATGRG